ncbi:MAG: hypothetical protein HYS44_00170 [Candidatus Niyogibacteria bacterium]|nr:hypothetical protein [Candidatus Niyogibacteria bacterium]
MRIFLFFAWVCITVILNVPLVYVFANSPPLFSPSLAIWGMLAPILLWLYTPRKPLEEIWCYLSLLCSILGMLASFFFQTIFVLGVGGMKQMNENEASQFVYWLFFGFFTVHFAMGHRTLEHWYLLNHPGPSASEPPESKSPKSKSPESR